MAALFDPKRQQFLIERFAISYSLGLGGSVSTERPESPLIAGTSQPSPSFPNPLPGVLQETQQLQALLGGTKLLNDSFTPETLSKQLKNKDYKLLHLASHGKFAGLVEETIVQTGQKALSLSEFEQLLRSRQSPLIHLTLSACETATGNRYAILGLAGMGIRAGIPTVMGTLWFAADLETADFVLNFYRVWQGGASREQALRESQVARLARQEHPANWSNFVLLQN